MPVKKTIAINRGTAKKVDALELGAHHYIDATDGDVADSLNDLGGVAVVLGTAGASNAMAATVGGLQPLGELITIGVTPEPLPISPLQLITTGLSIIGHPSGTASEIEDTMRFAVQTGSPSTTRHSPRASGPRTRGLRSGRRSWRRRRT